LAPEDGASGKGMRKPSGVVVSGVIKGVAVRFDRPLSLWWEQSEVHISEDSGFTPSKATKKDYGRKTEFEITEGLSSGKTYYLRVVHVDRFGNRSVPSDEKNTVALYIGDDDIDPTGPPAPENFSLRGLYADGEYAIEAEWDTVETAKEYQLLWRKPGQSWRSTTAPDEPDNGVVSILLAPLQVTTTYEARVRSISSTGQPGPFTATLSETTPGEPDPIYPADDKYPADDLYPAG